MTREDFLTIYAGIQYWLAQYRIEKVTLLQRMLYEIALDSFKHDGVTKSAESASGHALNETENLDIKLQQTKAAVFIPDIDDNPEEACLLSLSDIEAFLPKDAIGDTSPVCADDILKISLDMFVFSLMLNDPEDMKLAAATLTQFSDTSDPVLLPRCLACSAYLAYQNNKPATAKEKFQKSLELAPESAETYMLRSLVAFNASKHERALADIERAEMLKKGDILIQSLHADILFERRDIDRALKLHCSVIERCPTLRRSLLSLGVIYLERGEPGLAYPYLSTLLRNEPLNWFALSCLGDIFSSQAGQTFRAIPYYTMSIIAGADEPLIYLNLLMLIIHAGKYDAALSLIRELLEPQKKENKTACRLGKIKRLSKYKTAFLFLKLICEIIVEPFDKDKALEQLASQLNLIQADKLTALLIKLLYAFVTFNYEDDIRDLCQCSMDGIKLLELYVRNSQARPANAYELILISAVTRMAIWHGFSVEARAFLNLLSQIQESPLQDAVALLENEFFEHEALARAAHVDTATLHTQLIQMEGDYIIYPENGGKKNPVPSSPWYPMISAALGIRPHHDWKEILFAPQDETPYFNLLNLCQNKTFSQMAPRIRDCIAYLHDHLSEPYEKSLPTLHKIILKGKVFTHKSPETQAILDYLKYWFQNETAPVRRDYRTHDFWASIRFDQNTEPLFGKNDVSVPTKAQNDDAIDANALKFEYFVNTQRPRYLDDTSFKTDVSVWDFPFFELSADKLKHVIDRLSAHYAQIYERTLPRNATSKRRSKKMKDIFYHLLYMLHGEESLKEFNAIHKEVKDYDAAIKTVEHLAPPPSCDDFRLALASWRTPTSPYHMLPHEPFPSQPAFIRCQKAPSSPKVNAFLEQPVPGNLITWHDLREMFHNYAVWAVHEALDNGREEALEILLNRENNFTFLDALHPYQPITTTSAMLQSIAACKEQAQRQPAYQRIMIPFASGTNNLPFLLQFDQWAERLASELLPECLRIEHAVYHVSLQRSFETRCRIQSVLNRFPFLSRLYILQAAMFFRLHDTAMALKSIQDGLEWEDRLYGETGWNPIHPDPQNPKKEMPFEIGSKETDEEYPYSIWKEERLELNHEHDLSYFFSPWNMRFRMRTRKKYAFPRWLQPEMIFDKAGAFDFYRLFSNFIKEIPHIANVYLHAVAMPGLWGLHEYMRFALRSLESNQAFEFHRQLAELMVQIYPLSDEMIPARFCCDNGFAINAMLHAAMTFVCKKPEGTHHDAYEASGIIGASLYDIGYIPEAYKFLKIAVNSPKPTPLTYLTLGCVCIENRLFDEAVEYLKQGCALDPYNDRFYFNLALGYIELGDFQNAESILRKGIIIARAPFDIGVQLLRVLVKTERIHEAVDLAKMLNKADHDMFAETMSAIEFTQFALLNPVKSLLEEQW